MDFSLGEEERAVRDLARQILADGCTLERLQAIEDDVEGDGLDRPLWQSLAEAHLLGVAIPSAQGGSDLGLEALCVLLEEAGRHLAPLPLLSTLVYGALPIAEFGTSEQREHWLPEIAAGRAILSAALEEPGSRHPAQTRTIAEKRSGGWRLEGQKVCVPAADIARRILIPARVESGDVGLFLVDPERPGVERETARSNRHERQFLLRLRAVEVAPDDVLGELETGEQQLEWLDQRAQVALCSLMLGVAEEALRQTAEYTSTRRQFGRPIASFQAVAMRAADAFVDLEAMRSTLWQARWRLARGRPAAEQVAAAKWWACRGGQRVVHTAQHLHGGIGSDTQYPVHRYFLWARQIELTLGAAGEQLARLGQLLQTATG